MKDIEYYEDMLKAKDELIESLRDQVDILKSLKNDYKTAYEEILKDSQLKSFKQKLGDNGYN